MTSEQLQDTAQRAALTFFQGALAAAPVTAVTDWNAFQAAVVSMGIGGGAAVLSALTSWLRHRKTA